MLVAIMSQPMRAPYCRAYLAQADFASAIVLVGERRMFKADDMPPGVEMRIVDNKTVYGSPLIRLRARTRRRLADWSRTGSRAGRLAGRLGRAVERMARRIGRRKSPKRFPATYTGHRPADDPILTQLESIHRTQPIGRIVVFDLFDLPPAIEFADRAGIEVLVR